MWHRHVARRQRLRAPDRRAARDRRHRHRRGDRRRGPRRAPGAAGAGALPPVAAGRRRAACSALDIRQPDGPGLHGRRVAGAVAEVVVAGRFLPARGARDPRRPLRRRRRRAARSRTALSIAELVIPYGDPESGSYRKNAFDTGEVGMGYFTNSLELGCDCLGEIRYLDVRVADADGSVRDDPERHLPARGGRRHALEAHRARRARRGAAESRRFVVSSFVTVDNYEYGYYWYFGQDGSIEFEAKLTGIVLTLAAPGDKPRYGTEVAPGVLAPIPPAHLLRAPGPGRRRRGATRWSRWTRWRRRSGPDNPYGGAYVAQETPLGREAGAQRGVDPCRSRYWKVVNPGRTQPRSARRRATSSCPATRRTRWRRPTRHRQARRVHVPGTCG